MQYHCLNPTHTEIYEDPPFRRCPVIIHSIKRKRRRGNGEITIDQHCNLPLQTVALKPKDQKATEN